MKRICFIQKMVCLLLIITISAISMLSIPSIAHAEEIDPYALNTKATDDERMLILMNEASEYHGILLEHFKCNNTVLDDNKGKNTYSGLYSYQYPEEFAGAYIGAAGNLIVLLTDGNEEYSSTIQQLCGSNNILFRSVRYSYRELLELMDIVFPFIGDGTYGFEVSYVSVNDYKNCIDVYMKDISDVTIQRFKESVTDSDAIVFHAMEEDIHDAVNYISAGSKITANSYAFSVGFRCTRGSETGIVTVRHGAGYGDSVYYNYGYIGSVTSTYLYYDAAFVNLENLTSFEGSNNIASTGKILYATSLSTITQGNTVYKYGQKTGETYGVIVSSSTNYSSEGITYSDAFSSSFYAYYGDSGAVVYSSVTSTYQRLSGMFCAFVTNGNSFSAKASNIISILGLSRY